MSDTIESLRRKIHSAGELLETLLGNYHRLRQSRINEELFDVISGYEALENGHD